MFPDETSSRAPSPRARRCLQPTTCSVRTGGRCWRSHRRPGPLSGSSRSTSTAGAGGLEVPPMETLGFTLRYKLGLTGTKIGCDRAECGACTVLVDGVPHYSCSLLTHSVRGREVTSIRRPRSRGWHAAPDAAGGPGRAGFPVRVLHVRVHHEHGGAAQRELEPDTEGRGRVALGQPVSVRRLRQDL